MYDGGKWWKKISLENRIIALRILTFNDLIEVISNIQVIKMVFKIFLLKNHLLIHTLFLYFVSAIYPHILNGPLDI